MKNKDILSLVLWFWSPVAVILLGAALAINPDLVSLFVSRLLAGVISLVGIGLLLAAIFGQENRLRKVIGWLACSSVGSWLIASPLMPAAFAGRILGILLAIRGIRDLTLSRYRGGRILSLVCTVLGIVLILLPMTASRLAFSLCGVAILLSGVAMLVEKWKQWRYPDGRDSSIIDAL